MFIWECKESGGNQQKSVVHAVCLVHVAFQNHQMVDFPAIVMFTAIPLVHIRWFFTCASLHVHEADEPCIWRTMRLKSQPLTAQGTTRRAVGFQKRLAEVQTVQASSLKNTKPIYRYCVQSVMSFEENTARWAWRTFPGHGGHSKSNIFRLYNYVIMIYIYICMYILYVFNICI